MNLIDLTGEKFGRLRVLCRDLSVTKEKRVSMWLCVCDCGELRSIRRHSLTSGITKSCGCFQKDIATTHGMSRGPIYQAWLSMKRRCGIIKGDLSKTKKNYINRKITVCKEWLRFKPFYEWAKNKYHEGLVLDRKNTNGNYTPENCRFVTQKTNNQNSRRSKFWFILGRQFESAKDAAIFYSVSQTSIRNWCYGYISRGKHRSPRKRCYAVNKY